MIPVLLTCGVLLGTLGGLWFTLDPDAPLRASRGAWLPATLIAIAAVLLALAAINMAQVRHLLRASASSKRQQRHPGPR